MKRLTLLTILLVVVGLASGFALEVKPAFTLSGSGTLTWGVNLDNGDTGFKNTYAAALTVTLMADNGTDTHAGKDGLYGSITISEVELYWVTGVWTFDPLSVTANLFYGPFQFGIYANPAMNSEGAPAIEAAQDTGNAIVNAILVAEPAFTFGAYNTNQGTFVQYNMGANWVKLDIVSHDAWDNLATKSEYAAGLQTSMVFAPVTVGLGVFQGINWTPSNPIGGYVTTDLALTGMGSAKIGFDWQYDFAGATFTYDVYAQAQANFNKDATAYLLAKLFYGSSNNLDSALYLMIPANTLIGAFNADLTFFALDLTTVDFDLGALAHLGYNFKLSNGWLVAPTLFVAWTSVGSPAVNSLQIGPQVVVTIASAPSVTWTTGWTSGNLLAAPAGMGAITTALTVTY